MNFARILRRWLPLIALIAIASGSWQAAQAADTDEESLVDVSYDNSLGTPLLSARRVPETLQAPVADDAIRPLIDDFIEQLSLNQEDAQSCLVVEVEGRILENEGANLALIPASNQKLLTTYVVLEHFGPNTQFTTEVARAGDVVGGVLNGDLYLIGGGDPFLVSDDWRAQFIEKDDDGNVIPTVYERPWSRLEDLADAVAASGLTEVSGSLIADETLFDTIRFGPWAERLVVQNQSGPLSALSVNEGFAQWGADNPAFSLRVKADDPALNAAAVFRTLLAERGVIVAGIAVGERPVDAVGIASLSSPPLSDLVTHVNSWSNNYGAEILLKHLGLAVSGQGSTEAGAAAVAAILSENSNFNLDGIVIDDGSGLAETDRLTCALINDLLNEAGLDSALGQSLSIGGERGSVALRHEGTDADGNVYVKTGTLNPSTALSGFVVSPDNPDVVITFSYISNATLVAQSLRDLQEPFVESLTTYPDAPPIEVLDPADPIPVPSSS